MVLYGVEELLFIFLPNTELDRPLQSYFRINSKNMGQFERTLIIVDDNSSVHYMEDVLLLLIQKILFMQQ